jgi:enoyl-CoA hydratase
MMAESSATLETILVEKRGRVGVITLNRPKALNALNTQMMIEIGDTLKKFDADLGVNCIVITGSEKSFAAGADIKEMQPKTFIEMYLDDFFGGWDAVARTRKPTIAAVSGFALGGGCELAMMCDMIIASETAKFGQPEIKIGVMPGIGGSQRLIRAVGKAKAMEMCLTGRMMDAKEGERSGLVAKVVPAADLLKEAMAIADVIGTMSLPIVMMTKESINRAHEVPLSEGVRFERKLLHAMFATKDQKEGMAAFIEKRSPAFSHE